MSAESANGPLQQGKTVPREKKPITETEFNIMNVLWQRGSATIREIVESLYQEHAQSLHAGTRSLLDRLTDKGYVTSERHGLVLRFSATMDRETFVEQQVQELADSHFDGSVLPILLSMVDKVKLRKRDREAIREIIEKIK